MGRYSTWPPSVAECSAQQAANIWNVPGNTTKLRGQKESKNWTPPHHQQPWDRPQQRLRQQLKPTPRHKRSIVWSSETVMTMIISPWWITNLFQDRSNPNGGSRWSSAVTGLLLLLLFRQDWIWRIEKNKLKLAKSCPTSYYDWSHPMLIQSNHLKTWFKRCNCVNKWMEANHWPSPCDVVMTITLYLACYFFKVRTRECANHSSAIPNHAWQPKNTITDTMQQLTFARRGLLPLLLHGWIWRIE